MHRISEIVRKSVKVLQCAPRFGIRQTKAARNRRHAIIQKFLGQLLLFDYGCLCNSAENRPSIVQNRPTIQKNTHVPSN